MNREPVKSTERERFLYKIEQSRLRFSSLVGLFFLASQWMSFAVFCQQNLISADGVDIFRLWGISLVFLTYIAVRKAL